MCVYLKDNNKTSPSSWNILCGSKKEDFIFENVYIKKCRVVVSMPPAPHIMSSAAISVRVG